MKQATMLSPHTELVGRYFSYSQKYYRWFLGGAQHHGFHPLNKKISEREAQKKMLEKVAEELQLPPDSSRVRILDAGSGQGVTSIYLAEQYGCRVDGVTVTPSEVPISSKDAQKRGVAHLTKFSLMDYSQTAFDDDTFDRVLTLEALVHALNVRTALAEFYRVLKPGGRLVLFEYTTADDTQFTAPDRAVMDMVVAAGAVDGMQQIREHTFHDLVEEVGFSEITMQNITQHTLPTLRYLRSFAFFPYLYAKWRGTLADHPNRLAAVEFYRMSNDGLIQYHIITAVKA